LFVISYMYSIISKSLLETYNKSNHKWLILTDMIMHTEIVNCGGTYFLSFCVRYS